MRNTVKISFVFTALLLLGLSTEMYALNANPVEIVVWPKDTKQTIVGFGVSGAWWAQYAENWGTPTVNKIVKLLFNRKDGIGLSIYRYYIGAGDGKLIKDPWRRSHTFEPRPGKWNWNADKSGVEIMSKAVKEGVDSIVLMAYSPPAWMTINGSVAGGTNGGSNLKPDMYNAFAAYLVKIVKHFIDMGFPIKWLSPVNEPQWNWGMFGKTQESCHYSPQQVVKLSLLLLSKIKENNLNVKLEVPESANWILSIPYANALFGNPTIDKNVAVFWLHSYWSGLSAKKIFYDWLKMHFPDKKIGMSEYCQLIGGSRGLGMESALNMAKTIYEDLTVGNVVSWQWWLAVSKYNYHDGLLYVNFKEGKKESTSLIVSKRLWVFGNFSRFVRPGFVRVEDETDSKALKTVSFANSSKDKIVIVVINDGNETVKANIGVRNDFKVNVFSAFRTNKTENLKMISHGHLLKSFAFDPQSVTTLVLNVEQR